MSIETSTAAATVHDDGAEKAVLGILLLTPDATPDARRRLATDDFYKPLHQQIYAAACRLDDDHKPVEAAALLSELTRSGEVKNTGEAASYIAELVSNAPASAALGHYTSLVKDAATRRALALMGLRAQQLAAIDGADNPAEIVETLRNQLDSLATDRIGSEVPLAKEVVALTLDEIDALAKGESVVGIPTGFHELDHALNGLRPGQMVIVAARPGAGKALALDTPIPTPTGWTTMGELAVGDQVLGRDGKPTTVTAATDVMHDRECFEVVFSDGSTLVADAEHQWVTDTRAERKTRRAKGLARSYVGRTSRTTRELYDTLRAVDGAANHAVPVAEPLALPEADLPIAPYALGAWLGDGKSEDARLYSADPGVVDSIRACGYLVEKTNSKDPYEYRILISEPRRAADRERVCVTCGATFRARTAGQVGCSHACGVAARTGLPHGSRVRSDERVPCQRCGEEYLGFPGGKCGRCSNESFRGLLRDLGVLSNKHIPAMYLRASVAQRRALLAGLLDTDGTSPGPRKVEYTTTRPELADGVFELVASLGFRPSLRSKRVNGRTEATSTAITISFSTSQNVFQLERKRARHQQVAAGARVSEERGTYRYIADIRPVASVPVRCIQVDNDEHLYLAGRAMIPTHNTAMGLDWVRHAAVRQKKAVMMFSLEMGRTELMMRLLSAEAYVDLQSMKTGDLDDHKWQQLAAASARLADAKLGIDDTATVTITEIRAKARAFQRTHGLDMIVIDYLQLMNSDKKTDSRQQEVSDISRGVKLMAKEFGVPVVALSQLNRGSESRSDKKPVISDLRESGSLEQDADVVLLLHREEMYEKESPRAGEADVIIAKQRSGPTGTVVLSWLGKYSRFDNRSI